MQKTARTASVSKTEPHVYPYAISIKKLLILSFATLGTYDVYWFYKQWKFFSKKRHNIFVYILLCIFSPVTSYFLFSRIEAKMRLQDKNLTLDESKGRRLSFLYFFLGILNKLPDPWGYIYLFRVLALVQVQRSLNRYWEKEYGEKLVRSPFGTGNIIWTIIGLLVIALILYG